MASNSEFLLIDKALSSSKIFAKKTFVYRAEAYAPDNKVVKDRIMLQISVDHINILYTLLEASLKILE